MAENLPINFSVPPETVPTYNAIDAALGVGYATYYAVHSHGSKFLSPTPTDSDSGQGSYLFTDATETGASNVYVKLIDYDYDLLFKTPQVVEGVATVSFTVGIQDNASAEHTGYYVITLYHVSVGAVETSIGTYGSDSAGFILNNSGVDKDYRRTYDITCTKTSFNVGEKLRLSVHVYGKTSNGAFLLDHRLYHDGSNRQASDNGDGILTSHDTDIVVNVPYRINL
jgi:hypothetical protein